MTGQAASQIAVITGASSGIGRATAVQMAKAGYRLALGARRTERLQELASEIDSLTNHQPLVLPLDVTSVVSSENFVRETVAHYGGVHVLVNNAGKARGSSYIADTMDETEWREMLETNVMGLLRLSRLFLPHILQSGQGHIINLGSISGRETYAGGSVYCATKFAVRAITETLRQELLGKPVRVTTVDPGMVETEFSLVRYEDEERAAAVYEGMTPLAPEDIADCVVFAATRPPHVNIDAIIVKPLDQAGNGKVARH